MCDMREMGVATNRGKGPEFGNGVGMYSTLTTLSILVSNTNNPNTKHSEN